MNTPAGWMLYRPGVYRAAISPLAMGGAEIAFLKSRLMESPLLRVRVCTHHRDTDTLHEMLIAIQRGSYIRPHLHPTKTESFHMVEGEMDVVIFDDAGHIEQVIPLAEHTSNRPFYYRLSTPKFHSLVIRTAAVVFQEITTGPFRKEETVYADWSPAETDALEVAAFQQTLAAQVSSGAYERRAISLT